MKSTYRSRPEPAVSSGLSAGVLLALVGVLVIGNIMSNRVLTGWAYVPWNLAVALAVVLVARRDVGLAAQGWTRWRSGLRWGGVLALATLVAYLATVAVAPDVFEDRRVGGGVGRLLYETIVRIPLGTVMLEEVAFRGAVPAVAARRWGLRRGVLVASLLFGLWHVLPAWGIDDVNPVLDRLFGAGWQGQLAGVTLAVGATFIAGLWLCWLRYRFGSLLTTVIAHTATNSFGYAVAWFVTR